MTQQQAQQQTQKEEKHKKDLKEDKINKKEKNKEYKKKISVQVNSFYDEDPEGFLDRLLFAIYECKLFDSICDFLFKKVSKYAKDETSNWGVVIITILAIVLIIPIFKTLIPEGYYPTLDIIKNSIIVFFTIISIFATARMKKRSEIVGVTTLFLLIPFVFILNPLSGDDKLKVFFESFNAMLIILSAFMAFLTVDDYYKYKLDETKPFESEKKYDDKELDNFKKKIKKYLTNMEKSENNKD